MQSTIREFELKHNRTLSEDEIREELNLTQSEYGKLLHETQPVTFIPIHGSNQEAQGEDSLPLSETLDDPTQISSSEKLEGKEKILLLKDKIKNLPISKKFLMLYYFEELRLAEIAHIFKQVKGELVKYFPKHF